MGIHEGANLFRYGTYAAPDKWALVGPRANHRLVTNNPSLKMLQLIGTGFFVIAR